MAYLLNLWIYFLQSCTSPYSRLEFLSYWETGWRVLLNPLAVLCSASILEPFSWLGFKKTLACPWLAEPETLILCTRNPKFYHKWHPILNKMFDFYALSLTKLLESPTLHIGASWIPIPCEGVVSKDMYKNPVYMKSVELNKLTKNLLNSKYPCRCTKRKKKKNRKRCLECTACVNTTLLTTAHSQKHVQCSLYENPSPLKKVPGTRLCSSRA